MDTRISDFGSGLRKVAVMAAGAQVRRSASSMLIALLSVFSLATNAFAQPVSIADLVEGPGTPVDQADTAPVGNIFYQPPDLANAFLADSTNTCDGITGPQSMADNFVLSEQTSLWELVFWGMHFLGIEANNFTIRILEDSAGLPGAVANGGAATFSGLAGVLPTGQMILGTFNEIQFTFNLGGLTLAAGTYWVEIYNTASTGNNCFWWESSSTVDPQSGVVDSVFDVATPGAAWVPLGDTDTGVTELAFALVPTQATFNVSKNFSDSNPGDVTIELDCTSGSVSVEDPTANEVDSANFSVTGFASGTTCDASENPVPAGYSDTTGDACTEVGITQALESGCTIQNTQNPVQITVEKEYTDGAAGTVNVDMDCGGQGTLDAASKPASPGEFAQFTLSNFPYTGATCTATESDVPDGYYLSATTCENMDLQVGGGARCVLTNSPTRTTFEVNKMFSDGAQTPVMVEIDCNTGAIPDFQKVIDPNDDPWEIKWIITDFDTGELDCTVSELPLAGYTPDYRATLENSGDLLAFGTPSNLPGGCRYEGAVGGEQFRCEIWNTLQSVEVEVTKKWFDEHPEFNNSFWARVKWECVNAREEYYDGRYLHDGGLITDYGHLYFKDDDFDEDNEAEESFWVFPNWDVENDPTVCEVRERIKDSSVESDDSDCEELKLYPGIVTLNKDDEPVGATCTIVNTRIYEGIPTLSQYGLALMALLMLGVGLVGFRRIA